MFNWFTMCIMHQNQSVKINFSSCCYTKITLQKIPKWGSGLVKNAKPPWCSLEEILMLAISHIIFIWMLSIIQVSSSNKVMIQFWSSGLTVFSSYSVASHSRYFFRPGDLLPVPGGGGFLVQRSILGRAAEMGLKISLLV